MGVSKFIYGDQVKFDITDTTATPETVLSGYTFHGANGEALVGNAEGGSLDTNDYLMRIGGENYNNLAYMMVNRPNYYFNNTNQMTGPIIIGDNIINTFSMFKGNTSYLNSPIYIGNNCNVNTLISGGGHYGINYHSNIYIGNDCIINAILVGNSYNRDFLDNVNIIIGDNCEFLGPLYYSSDRQSPNNINIIIGNNCILHNSYLFSNYANLGNNFNLIIGDSFDTNSIGKIITGVTSFNGNIIIGNNCNIINGLASNTNFNGVDIYIGDRCNCTNFIDNIISGVHKLYINSNCNLHHFINGYNEYSSRTNFPTIIIHNDCNCHRMFYYVNNFNNRININIGTNCNCYEMFYYCNFRISEFYDLIIHTYSHCNKLLAYSTMYYNNIEVYLHGYCYCNNLFGKPMNNVKKTIYTRYPTYITTNGYNNSPIGINIAYTRVGSNYYNRNYNLYINYMSSL